MKCETCENETAHPKVVLCGACANRKIRTASDKTWDDFVEALGVPDWTEFREWLIVFCGVYASHLQK